MSTMAMASSSLNPNAPLFIPAAYRQVEDFSPEWWELVKTTAWFRDHWFRQHQLHEAAYDDAAAASFGFGLPPVDDADADDVDLAALLPDDSVDLLDTDDLFYTPDLLHHQQQQPATKPLLHAGYDLDVLRAVSLGSPRAVVAAPSPRAQPQQHRPVVQHVGVRGAGAARRVIHQPR